VPQNWGTGPQEQICTVLWTLRPGRHRLAAIEGSRRPVSGPSIWITVAQGGY
jgi:hypothetical protein